MRLARIHEMVAEGSRESPPREELHKIELTECFPSEPWNETSLDKTNQATRISRTRPLEA